MKHLIYSLKYINDKPVLDTALSSLPIQETDYFIRVTFPNRVIRDLARYEYLNTMKVFDDGAGNVFIICTKKVSTESAFSKLIHHMINKIDKRVASLLSTRDVHIKELVAA